MSEESSIPDGLRGNAEFFVQTMMPERVRASLTYDAAGVELVDGYIGQFRDHILPETRTRFVSAVGAFLGECIVKTYGGKWEQMNGTWGVRVSEHLWADPFTSVRRQLDGEPFKSVLSFFQSLPRVEKLMREQNEKRKRGGQ
ncbi:MAG TPA: hypothetical protein VL992_15280 [Tepidisphaeraceae bacterium]|nr:hypothetical protein [Tepidisphaeraceae bacterium]